MKNEDILRIAQKSKKDERIESLTVKAGKVAGNVSILLSCVLALVIIIDGYILESDRSFDFLTVAFMLIGVGSVNNAVFALYQLFALKKYSRIVDVLVFGSLTIASAIKCIVFFLK